MRVLIAEDDTVSRMITQRAVERFGHECRSVDDGAQAWKLYQDGSFDVVLTDWVMPGIDGLDLCRRIRQHPGPSYTYVMLLSVLSDRGHFLEGMQAGADDFLAKPLDPEELQARLEAAARANRLHHRLAQQNAHLERLLREQQSLAVNLAETAEARGRLEGVTLVAREVVHLLTNDLTLAVGAVDLARQRTDISPELAEFLDEIEEGLSAAERHLAELQRVVRVKTKDTPVGPSLDLSRSTHHCP
jgi:DNA-binding response OmpR family regulator